jgi:type I restriction enzyme S subunit
LSLVPIKDIAKIHYGKALKKDDRIESGNVDVFGSNGPVGSHDEFLFEAPTVIIGRKGSVGKTIYTEEKSWTIDTAFYSEVDKDKVDIKYFYYALTAKDMEQYAITTSIPGINRNDIYDLKIPLPSLSKQKAIVAKLDRAQRLIDIDKEMLAKYDDLIQSVFLEMFGDPVTNPKGWEVKKLGDLTTKVGSGSTPRGGSKVYQDHGNIFIRSQNVLMNKMDLSDVAYIADEIHKGMKNTWVQENDVLLNITGASIGRVCVYNKSEAANVNQHVCILRPVQDEIKPFYLSNLISSKNYQDKILGQQTGGTRQAFNMTQIKNFDIPLPPLDLQTKFNEILTKLKGEVQSIKLNSKKSEELFSSLVQGVFG